MRVSSSMLWSRLHDWRPVHGGLVHHSDRGCNTCPAGRGGIEPSVGSVGDSYDNALTETINGLYKAEIIHRRGPPCSFEAVEFATLEWVDWFNHRRLLEPHRKHTASRSRGAVFRHAERIWLHNLYEMASGKPGAVQALTRIGDRRCATVSLCSLTRSANTTGNT